AALWLGSAAPRRWVWQALWLQRGRRLHLSPGRRLDVRLRGLPRPGRRRPELERHPPGGRRRPWLQRRLDPRLPGRDLWWSRPAGGLPHPRNIGGPGRDHDLAVDASWLLA